MSLVQKMKKVHAAEGRKKLNCAMIDCQVSLMDYGKPLRFRRFSCWSYSESLGRLSGLLHDKELGTQFHVVIQKGGIMMYPVRNDNYNPHSFVAYFELIKKKIDKDAQLMTWPEFIKKHKDDT